MIDSVREVPRPPQPFRRRRWLLFLGACLLLLAAEMTMKRTLAAYVARPDFRFMSHSMAGWPELRADLAASAAPKIFFLGDSIVQGIAVGKGSETIPYGFHQTFNHGRTRPLRVVNAGLAGSSLETNYLFLEQLLELNPAAVFLVVNYRTLGRRGISPAYAEQLGVQPILNDSPGKLSPYSFAALARHHLSLLRNRTWLLGWWLGSSPQQAIQRFYTIAAMAGWREAALRELHLGEPRRWNDIPWNLLSREALLDSFAIPPLPPDDPRLLTIGDIGRLAAARGIKLFVAIPPLNLKMVESLAVLDLSTYRYNVQMIEQAARGSGAVFLDATTWLDDSFFSDSVHLTPAGNLAFGRLLAEQYLHLAGTAVE